MRDDTGKNENRKKTAAETLCAAVFFLCVWRCTEEYRLCVAAKANQISVSVNGELKSKFQDDENPYLQGVSGLSVQNGSRLSCRWIEIS
ncbi:MAG: hypothetical protein HFG96_04950 [Lachnospiraceae bacterium]|nr:hypothetical protein [Lachnospiraceae bacterium]